MNRIMILASLFFIGILTTSFSQNNIATVKKINGFYVFTDSEPIGEYDVIGEVNTTGHTDPDLTNSLGQYQAVRDYLIRAARQANYSADGLIMTLVNGGTDKAVIIKFKENSKNKDQAKVNQYNGIYIFTDCEPTAKSKYLGTIKSKGSMFSAQYTTFRDKLIKSSFKKYPDVEGLIIKLVVGGTNTGDAIKF